MIPKKYSIDWTKLLLSAIALGAAALANTRPLWIDERITLHFIHDYSWSQMPFVITWQDPHFPTYFALIRLVGPTVGVAVSMVAFGITVYASMSITEILYDNYWSMYATGAIVALSPFLATQGTWLRMYAMLTCFMTIGLWQYFEGNIDASIAAFWIAATLHVYAVFGLVWLITVDRTKKSIAAAVVGCTPAVVLIAGHWLKGGFTTYGTGMGSSIKPDPTKILLTPISSLVGSHYTGLIPELTWPIIIVGLLASLLIMLSADRRLVLWVTLPIAGIVIASFLLHPVYRIKYFGFIAPVVAIMITDPNRQLRRQLPISMSTVFLYAIMWAARLAGMMMARRLFV